MTNKIVRIVIGILIAGSGLLIQIVSELSSADEVIRQGHMTRGLILVVLGVVVANSRDWKNV